jgi:hypothetical protein
LTDKTLSNRVAARFARRYTSSPRVPRGARDSRENLEDLSVNQPYICFRPRFARAETAVSSKPESLRALTKFFHCSWVKGRRFHRPPFTQEQRIF